MKEIVFATGNLHKLKEAQEILGASIKLKSLTELGFDGEIPEEQETIEGNAIQKAQFIAQKYNVDCFADDTGLEVDALKGRPGVYSARYAGPDCSFADNMQKVLDELDEAKRRTARFRCVIAAVISGQVYTFEGIVEGVILRQPQGDEGFGYDPVFQPIGKALSFAEMTPEQKHELSHRGFAMRKLSAFLQKSNLK